MRQVIAGSLISVLVPMLLMPERVSAGEDEIAPKWSADGEYIYFYSYRHPDPEQVHKKPSFTMRMRVDGTEKTVLSLGEHRNWWVLPLPCEKGACAETDLIVISERDAQEAFGGSNIYRYAPQKQTYEVLTDAQPAQGEWILNSSLSSDGRFLSYIWRLSFRGQAGARILLQDRHTGETQEINTQHAEIHDVALMPDGSGLVFSPNENQIFHLNLQDGTSRLVFEFAENEGQMLDGLTVRPDGKALAFSYGPSGITTTEIYRVSIDGSGLTQLTKNDVADLRPDWSPDGKKIAFNNIPNPEQDWNDIIIMKADGEKKANLTGNSGK